MSILNSFLKGFRNGKSYFPFSKTKEEDEPYSIIVPLEDDEFYPKYFEFFAKHGYEGNGYCWEGHIIQILEAINCDLLEHIEFDPEGGTFLAYADSKKSQVVFLETLSPIFSDLNELEEWVKKADRERIDD